MLNLCLKLGKYRYKRSIIIIFSLIITQILFITVTSTAQILTDNLQYAAELRHSLTESNSGIFLYIISVFAVAVCCSLVIYNICYISSKNDIQIWSLFRVSGMTPRQVYKFILIDITLLYIVALVPGIISGYLIGWRWIGPLTVSMSVNAVVHDFNISVFLISITFTYLVAVFSAILPFISLNQYSCIEILNIDCIDDDDMKNNVGSSQASLIGIAIKNFKRNKKRNIIMIISITCSIVLVLFTSAFTTVMEKNINQKTDFLIEGIGVGRDEINITATKKQIRWKNIYNIDKDFYNEVISINGVKNVASLMVKEFKWEASPEVFTVIEQKINPNFTNEQITYSRNVSEIVKGLITIRAILLPDDLLQQYWSENEKEKLSDFIEGDSIIVFPFRYSGSKYQELFAQDSTIEFEKASLTVVNFSELSENMFNGIGVPANAQYYLTVLCNASVFNEINYDAKICSINIEIIPELYTSVEAILNTMKFEGITIWDKKVLEEEWSMRIRIMNTIGGWLTAIVFIGGLVNYINTIICSFQVRKREYAIMYILGITQNQFHKLLLIENSIIMFLILLCSCAMGFPLVKFAFIVGNLSAKINIIPILFMCLVTELISLIMIFFMSQNMHHKNAIKTLQDSFM